MLSVKQGGIDEHSNHHANKLDMKYGRSFNYPKYFFRIKEERGIVCGQELMKDLLTDSAIRKIINKPFR